MDERLKRLLQEDMKREADRMMEEMNRDPSLANIVVPEDIHENVFAQIREYEEKKAREYLLAEEKELIRLGKIYKRRCRWNRYVILAAALVCAMALGVTSMGGPEKVFEEVKRMMSGREQTRINTDSDRIDAVEAVTEVEAYEKIEEKFEFYPVYMDYLPDGMEFSEVIFYENMQQVQLIYENKLGGIITYTVCPNYRTGSTGMDVEDEVIEEYNTDVQGTVVTVKQYRVKDSEINRWIVHFKDQDVHYVLRLSGLEEGEIEKIVENLYFS